MLQAILFHQFWVQGVVYHLNPWSYGSTANLDSKSTWEYFCVHSTSIPVGKNNERRGSNWSALSKNTPALLVFLRSLVLFQTYGCAHTCRFRASLPWWLVLVDRYTVVDPIAQLCAWAEKTGCVSLWFGGWGYDRELWCHPRRLRLPVSWWVGRDGAVGGGRVEGVRKCRARSSGTSININEEWKYNYHMNFWTIKYHGLTDAMVYVLFLPLWIIL